MTTLLLTFCFEEDVDEKETDEETASLMNGCDALTEIGAFMNYPKLLLWCIEVSSNLSVNIFV